MSALRRLTGAFLLACGAAAVVGCVAEPVYDGGYRPYRAVPYGNPWYGPGPYDGGFGYFGYYGSPGRNPGWPYYPPYYYRPPVVVVRPPVYRPPPIHKPPPVHNPPPVTPPPAHRPPPDNGHPRPPWRKKNENY